MFKFVNIGSTPPPPPHGNQQIFIFHFTLIEGTEHRYDDNMFYRLFQVIDSDEDNNNQTTESEADVFSYQELSCHLPSKHQSYNVTVTLDGVTFSRDLMYVPYDSSCYTCDESGVISCTRKVRQIISCSCFFKLLPYFSITCLYYCIYVCYGSMNHFHSYATLRHDTCVTVGEPTITH